MISTNYLINPNNMPIQTPVQLTGQNQATVASPSSGGSNDVNKLLNDASLITNSLRFEADRNEQAQKAKEAQEAQKLMQQQYLAALPANQPNASQPSGTSPSTVMPRSASVPASDSSNPVEWAKNVASNAWNEANQLIANTAQSATQFVTGTPAQPATSPPLAMPNASTATSTGSKAEVVAQAANSLEGSSSKSGPGGGNVACAWKTAKALRAAGYDIKAGSPEEINVNAQVAFLKKKGATVIPKSEARPGDIVFVTGKHIGIVTAGQGTQAQVTSNSSSKAQFSWKSNLNFDGQYGQDSQILRLA